jgi:glycosyltransferase involved in cell wall biosynthesis
MGGLVVQLDLPLPNELAVGAGSALFVCGTCFHGERRIRSLSLCADGRSAPVRAHSMPRLDLFRSLHPALDPYATADISFDRGSDVDPHLHSYRSGFWGMAEFGSPGSAPHDLTLIAELEGGHTVTSPLATLPEPAVAAPSPPPPNASGSPEPLVCVCMASYEPPIDLFRRQIESIRAQTHGNWICVISDDCSSPESIAEMRHELGDDPRFVLSQALRRLGFYLNFERSLQMVPAEAQLVALCDQDDHWYPDKLTTLIERLGDATLVYSDARVIDRSGKLISDTYWVTRRHNHDVFSSLLVTNSVTGAASLFGRELLDYALPFPPGQFAHFHDHWIALVALALGRIEFVERPLYDYVQHGDATLGHATANFMPPLRSRLRSLTRNPRDRAVAWRFHYFVDVCRLMQWGTIVRARCAARMEAGKRAELDRFLSSDDSLAALADMWRRGALELLGRSQTLGGEWMLAYALTWRRLLSATIRDRPVKLLRLDALPPDALVNPPRSVESS